MSNARTLANTINANSEIVVPSGGIQFADATNANTVANQSNLIEQDGYEEGTFTPTVGGVSQSANGNWYTKIGRFVMVSADFTIDGAPSTNYTNIAGLPFSAGVDYSGVVTFAYNTDGSATMTGVVDTSGNMSLYSGGTARPSLNNGDRVIFAAYYQTV